MRRVCQLIRSFRNRAYRATASLLERQWGLSRVGLPLRYLNAPSALRLVLQLPLLERAQGLLGVGLGSGRIDRVRR